MDRKRESVKWTQGHSDGVFSEGIITIPSPGTRVGSGYSDQMHVVKSRKTHAKSAFIEKSF